MISKLALGLSTSSYVISLASVLKAKESDESFLKLYANSPYAAFVTISYPEDKAVEEPPKRYPAALVFSS